MPIKNEIDKKQEKIVNLQIKKAFNSSSIH